MGLLQATADPAREILKVERIDVVADKGLCQDRGHRGLRTGGSDALCAQAATRLLGQQWLLSQGRVSLDPDRDAYFCPGGHELKPFRYGKKRKMTKTDYANKQACADCPLRPRCTDAGYRAVSRLEHEDALDRMAARLKARPEVLDRRREMVEHPFGSIKQWMYQGAFLMRRLEKVRAEFSLTALVYNLRRALNIVGVDKLIAAVAA